MDAVAPGADPLQAAAAAADAGDLAAAAPAAAPGADPGAAAAAGLEAPKTIGPDATEEWIFLAIKAGTVAREALPEHIAEHWTDKRLERVGIELAEVAKRYRWTFDPGHPLAGLAMACFPLAWPFLEPHVKAWAQLQRPRIQGQASSQAQASSSSQAPASSSRPADPPAGDYTPPTGNKARPLNVV